MKRIQNLKSQEPQWKCIILNSKKLQINYLINHYTFKKNIFGKIKIQYMLYKNSKISLSFLETYNNFLKIAQAKLCLTNQLYEVSRLQFILTSICDRQVFRHCHDIGIRLKCLQFDQEIDKPNKQNIIKIENIMPQELKLENIESNSIEEINIMKNNPQASIEMQHNSIQIQQLNQSQSLFLGKIIENKILDDEDLKLSDEDFYMLMYNQLIKNKLQRQTIIKEQQQMEYETVTPQNQNKIQYQMQN